jgi:phosphoribosyl-ATP pyrophosphohydrolase/phosphoribosyl-AMP cyclohydrolase
MEYKIFAASMCLLNGEVVQGLHDHTKVGDYHEIAKMYNDSGIDKIIVLDLSESDEEHEKNVRVIREICRTVDIPVCAGGNIERLEDVQNLFFAGCKQVILNADKDSAFDIAEDAAGRFGKEKIDVSIVNVDFLFKHQDELRDNFHEILVLNPDILDAIDLITDLQYVVTLREPSFEEIVDVLSRENIRGITGHLVSDPNQDIMAMKAALTKRGIYMDNFAPKLSWDDLKKNSDGLVPVVAQDYRTNEVLMVAYMNEEAYNTTLTIGRMTYYSRSRKQLWTKGETSGHLQYVKSLTADCDYDTILAKVSQVGVACHTGARSCFFNEIVKKEYVEKSPLKIFETLYETVQKRKAQPQERSYTNYLMDRGLDEVLKKVGEEAVELIISAKNQDESHIRHEISDFLYHLVVLMVEKNVTWEEVTRELAQR